jgi:hypothetical protein
VVPEANADVECLQMRRKRGQRTRVGPNVGLQNVFLSRIMGVRRDEQKRVMLEECRIEELIYEGAEKRCQSAEWEDFPA